MKRAVGARFPELAEPRAAVAAIVAGDILVDGFPVRNPESLVEPHAVTRRPRRELAGEAKLRAAIAAFRPAIAGRVAVDVGAAAGGFTRVLLEHQARRVFAVDAGHGQLLGSLRQDPRVVNLERTNLGALSREIIPEIVDVVVIDVSYLALADAIPQLETLALARDAELVALVKPMFELGLDAPPPDDRLPDALVHATRGIARAPWRVTLAIDSPVTGHRGARELLVHARRHQ